MTREMVGLRFGVRKGVQTRKVRGRRWPKSRTGRWDSAEAGPRTIGGIANISLRENECRNREGLTYRSMLEANTKFKYGPDATLRCLCYKQWREFQILQGQNFQLLSQSD